MRSVGAYNYLEFDAAQSYSSDVVDAIDDNGDDADVDADCPTAHTSTDTAFFLPVDRSPRYSLDGRIRDASVLLDLKESLRTAVLDLYAATRILGLHLATFESAFCVLVSVVATTAYYVIGVRRSTPGGPTFGANISWMIVSIAVVSPMIMQIKEAFSRRELALNTIAEVRALVLNVFLAHSIWNWGDNGRVKLPHDHVRRTKRLLLQLISDTSQLLLLPTLTRGRHRFTTEGRRLALSFVDRTQSLQLHMVDVIRQLHEQVEVMKTAGLPANEASRINQYHWLLQGRLEKLQNIKFYRTPQATRSFTRLFILILPIFYGPYYVYLMRTDTSHHLNFGFCLSLSVLTTLTMIGLFNVEIEMEDPFVGCGLDGIRVKEIRTV
ncbi:hypothetical protein PINS_up002448 [Pythium insidiosum]|nr:hypothetical protein PINS_up002448 [Pythium insidiosum]